MSYTNKKYTIRDAEFPYAKTATLIWDELPSDLLEDIDGNELENSPTYSLSEIISAQKSGEKLIPTSYPIKALNTSGKGINDTTRLRMQNLKKQLKGYKFFQIIY